MPHTALPHATCFGSATFRSIMPLSTATSYAADVSVGVAGEWRLEKGGRRQEANHPTISRLRRPRKTTKTIIEKVPTSKIPIVQPAARKDLVASRGYVWKTICQMEDSFPFYFHKL